MQRYAVCQGEIGKKRHAAVIVRAVFNVSREVGGLSHADVNGHLALLCVGRGDHQSPALDREPDPAEGRGRIRREVSQSGDGDQAITAMAIWHEQVTALTWAVQYEMHRGQVSVGVLDPLHEVRIDQYATAKPRNSRLPGRHVRKQDRRARKARSGSA